jgi:hypothetical protein
MPWSAVRNVVAVSLQQTAPVDGTRDDVLDDALNIAALHLLSLSL